MESQSHPRFALSCTKSAKPDEAKGRVRAKQTQYRKDKILPASDAAHPDRLILLGMTMPERLLYVVYTERTSSGRLLEKDPTAKKLLYVLRTTLTGIHLLETGQLEPDLTRLMGPYGLENAGVLVERKRAGERVRLDPLLLAKWSPHIDKLLARLDAARETSPLPESPTNEPEVREWLLAVRRAKFA
jgi:hypothetical protein